VIGMVIGASDHGLTHWSEWDGADHILVQGNKSFDRLTNAGQFEPSHVSVVGCAKLDTPIHHPTSASAFNGRKIVLYNPHHDPRVSSWFRWGPDILDWFVDNDDYHLIFAPHVRLFDRAFARPQGTMRLHRVGRIQERWHNASNINIDLGSTASLGRDYTARADIYLGDAGAQLYEFLERPRPCAFLNAQDVSIKRVDHRHSNWGAGHMISDIALLGGVLETTQEWHAEAYRPMQEKMFAYSLSVTEQPAARRASDAITRFLASA
jgi:beta-glucanase (GH16 family)